MLPRSSQYIMREVVGCPATTRLNPVVAKEMQSVFEESVDVGVHTRAGDPFFVDVALTIGIRVFEYDPAAASAAGGVFVLRIRGGAHRNGDLPPQALRRGK